MAPVFTNNGFYAVRIREDVGVNSGVGVTVSATDADAKVYIINHMDGEGRRGRERELRRRMKGELGEEDEDDIL